MTSFGIWFQDSKKKKHVTLLRNYLPLSYHRGNINQPLTNEDFDTLFLWGFLTAYQTFLFHHLKQLLIPEYVVLNHVALLCLCSLSCPSYAHI